MDRLGLQQGNAGTRHKEETTRKDAVDVRQESQEDFRAGSGKAKRQTAVRLRELNYGRKC
jgi:hypothetical protein